MRRLVFLVVIVAAVAAFGGSARAGTYDVVACNSAPGGVNRSWTGYSTHPSVIAYTSCPSDGTPGTGIVVTANWAYASAYFSANASQTFMAPTGTSVVGMTYTGMLWRPGATVPGAEDLTADISDVNGAQLEGCQAVDGHACYGQHLSTPQSLTFSGRPGVKIDAGCWGLGRCKSILPWYSTEVGASTAMVEMQSVSVRVNDSNAPSASITGGDLVGGGWLRGTRTLTYAGSDNVGIRIGRVKVDGADAASETLPCDYTYATPCSNVSARSFSLDTNRYADGSHGLSLEVVDPGANVASASRTIQVDNHAPAAPAGVMVSPSSWSSTNRFDVSWTNPGSQAAPITKAHWTMCNASGSTCTSGVSSGTGISSLSGLTVPSAGAWDLAIWLEDAAGNTTASNAAAPVSLKFDDTPAPAAPRLTPPSGWIHDTTATVGLDGATSGAALGYSVTRDGTDPDATVDVSVGGAWSLTGLPEGTTTLKARVISRSNVAGAVAKSIVRVDRTAPTLKLFGAGDPATPMPGPVTVTIDATDALSGMAAADDGQPVTSGAYVAYTLDGGPEMMAAGDEATVSVSGRGDHRLQYWAVDLAGNRASTQERVVAVEPRGVDFYDPHPFSARSTNPQATFTAAASFGPACPSSATLVADRGATTAEGAPADPQPSAILRADSAAGARWNSLVGFSLPSGAGCAVTSAQLEVNVENAGPASRLSVCRAGGAWTEAGVSWQTQPGCVGLSVAAAPGAVGPTSVDLTEQIRAIYRTGDNGFVIRSLGGSVTLSARTNSDVAKRPRLVIGFER